MERFLGFVLYSIRKWNVFVCLQNREKLMVALSFDTTILWNKIWKKRMLLFGNRFRHRNLPFSSSSDMTVFNLNFLNLNVLNMIRRLHVLLYLKPAILTWFYIMRMAFMDYKYLISISFESSLATFVNGGRELTVLSYE